MIPVVLGVPPPPPPPYVPKARITLYWIGADGAEWNISNGEQGVAIAGDVVGLGHPEIDHSLAESPAVHGARWHGFRAKQRRVLLPLWVFVDADQEGWLEVNRAFWNGMRHDKPGQLVVEQPNGQRRYLHARLVGDGSHPLLHDPEEQGWEQYVIELLAEDPFWHGEPQRRSFTIGQTDSFFVPGDPGVLFISDADQGGTVAMANPGDVPGYPTWTLEGPIASDAAVGTAGAVVHIPFDVAEGETLVIDTRPEAQSARLNGELMTQHLGPDTRFAPVPAGQGATISVAFLGNGRVTVEFVPRYWRAM